MSKDIFDLDVKVVNVSTVPRDINAVTRNVQCLGTYYCSADNVNTCMSCNTACETHY